LTMHMETDISFAAAFLWKIFRRQKPERRHSGNQQLQSPKNLNQPG